MTSDTRIPTRCIPARSREVVAYHYDDARPGKPLYLLIPGGLIAVAAAITMVLVGRDVWVNETLDSTTGISLLLLLLLPYFGGLFIFSYGYELYDWRHALRLTLIAGAIGLAAVVASVAILYVLRVLAEGRSSSSHSSKRSESDGWAGSESKSSSGSRLNINLNISREESETSKDRPLSLATCPICNTPLVGGVGGRCPRCDPYGPTPKVSGT